MIHFMGIIKLNIDVNLKFVNLKLSKNVFIKREVKSIQYVSSLM